MLRILHATELRRAMGFDARYELDNGSRRLGNTVCSPVMRSIVSSLVSEAFPRSLKAAE